MSSSASRFDVASRVRLDAGGSGTGRADGRCGCGGRPLMAGLRPGQLVGECRCAGYSSTGGAVGGHGGGLESIGASQRGDSGGRDDCSIARRWSVAPRPACGQLSGAAFAWCRLASGSDRSVPGRISPADEIETSGGAGSTGRIVGIECDSVGALVVSGEVPGVFGFAGYRPSWSSRVGEVVAGVIFPSSRTDVAAIGSALVAR